MFCFFEPFSLYIRGFQLACWIPRVSVAESQGLLYEEEQNLWGPGSSTPPSTAAVQVRPTERLSTVLHAKGNFPLCHFHVPIHIKHRTHPLLPIPGAGPHRVPDGSSLQGLPGFCDRGPSLQENWESQRRRSVGRGRAWQYPEGEKDCPEATVIRPGGDEQDLKVQVWILSNSQ